MPDSLIINERPAQPFSTAAQPASPPVALLHRQMKEAERICDETRGEGDNGPTMQAYFRAHDRFIEAPVSSLADVLLKLEVATEHEDFEAALEEEPKLVYARVILNLRRDLRALSVGAAPALDLLAIHRAADSAVDRLYERQSLLGDGLAVLRDVFMEGVATHPRGAEVNFMMQAIKEIADNLIGNVDDIVNAIDPLNPTVLDDGSV